MVKSAGVSAFWTSRYNKSGPIALVRCSLSGLRPSPSLGMRGGTSARRPPGSGDPVEELRMRCALGAGFLYRGRSGTASKRRTA